MSDHDFMTDENVVNVTARHLRELRRGQDLMLDLVKRQNELMARFERSISELKSDVVLLENRSITAAENDEFFRRKLGELSEDSSRLETKIDSLMSGAETHPQS